MNKSGRQMAEGWQSIWYLVCDDCIVDELKERKYIKGGGHSC